MLKSLRKRKTKNDMALDSKYPNSVYGGEAVLSSRDDMPSFTPEKHPIHSYTDALSSLSGAWTENGMTAEEEIEGIYNARQSGLTRKDIELSVSARQSG